ncbi:MAG: phosphoenolpyruvate carboxykinase, partial [Candidatus Rokubacteria bacterium]|nr:phosphoenolpyruvate carboxykinase [Candidatus Rokubacteria bacterium]
MAENQSVQHWVNEVARMCRPDEVVWCDGSEAEHERLLETAVRVGDLMPLDQRALPGCYLHRSASTDVARTEHLTFICSREQADAGPTNNWMDPKEAYAKLSDIYRGLMKGRTMYVVPYLMGPVGSPHSKVGVELTDSVYVALNMQIMTRMGNVALEALGSDGVFVKGLHSIGNLDPAKRYICH